VKQINILWADDEIDLLKLQVMFLEEKGYHVVTATNGDDAIDLVTKHTFDIILLDENMPGKSGIVTLNAIKALHPSIPVVMITKSEEENIMEDAIGSKIDDYLIKPVNPKQILLAIKKNVETKKLIEKKTASNYQIEFTKLGTQINDTRTFADFVEVYKKLIYWELELTESSDNQMEDILKMQKNDANSAFAKFVKNNYVAWFNEKQKERPLMSPNIFKNRVFPLMESGKQVVFILIDNLRWDQWKTMQLVLEDFYQTETEEIYCTILPTATQYARNSIFSGLMPSEIEKLHPDFWLNDEEEGGKNLYEEDLLQKQLARFGKEPKFSFEKVLNIRGGKKVLENIPALLTHQLSVVIYNFVDMLSHARTEMQMIRELANDESAYRSLTLSWFKHSPLLELFVELAKRDVKIVLTTDHGTIRVNNPIKVVGDKNTNTNLRYKQGKNLGYNAKEVIEITNPAKAYLPSSNLSSTYIFARNDDFFAYPNNFHYYANYYKSTFQHGGVSLEEMLVPLIVLSPKK